MTDEMKEKISVFITNYSEQLREFELLGSKVELGTIGCSEEDIDLYFILLDTHGFRIKIDMSIAMKYINNDDIDGLVKLTKKFIKNDVKNGKKDTEVLNDWEKVKYRIHARVINHEANADELKNFPHNDYLDLAVIYQIKSVGKQRFCFIDNTLIDKWGVTIDDIKQAAEFNAYKDATRLFGIPLKIIHFAQLIALKYNNMKGNLGGAVVTGGLKQFRAASILNANNFRFIGCDCWIVPCSQYRVIAVPQSYANRETIENIAADIYEHNDEHIVLSNNIYHYSYDKNEITLLNRFFY